MPTIDQQDALTAAEITDKPDIRFGVSNLQGATPASNQMSLPELGKAIGAVINKDTVAEMLALTGVQDGTRVDTARYSTSHTVGDGSGGEYVYHSTGRSGITADGGFFHNGAGADDYWELKDQTVANVMQFGAYPGKADNLAEIQAAVDACEKVLCPAGTYAISDQIDVTSAITWSGPGKLNVPVNKAGIVVDLAAWGSAQQITGITAVGVGSSASGVRKTVTRLTVASHGLKQGDWVKITADETYGIVSGVEDFVGEIARVNNVADANTIDLSHLLEDVAAAFSGTAYLRKIPTDVVDINASFTTTDGSEGTTRTSNYYLIDCRGAIAPKLTARVDKTYGSGIRFHSCVNADVQFYSREMDDTATLANSLNILQYGVTAAGASVGGTVKVNAGGTRHAFTTRDAVNSSGTTYSNDIARMQEHGAPRDITVSGTSIGAYAAAFDTHSLAKRIVFSNCVAKPSVKTTDSAALPGGFQIRSKDSRLENCHVFGARQAYIFSTLWANSTNVLVGCTDENTSESTFVLPTAASDSLKVIATGYMQRSNCKVGVLQSGTLELKSSSLMPLDASTAISQYPFELSGNANAILSGITHYAGTGALPPIRVISGTSFVRVRDYHLRDENADTTPYGFCTADSGATLNLDADDVTFDGVFFLQGFVRTSSAGTVNLLNDRVEYAGNRVSKGTGPPTTRQHSVGDRVYPSTPSSSGVLYWECVVSGTPGTWEARLANVYKIDTVAEMLALTNVADGQQVNTARYSTSHTVGDGSGGEYVYDADSTATIDGGFVMPGIGGSLSWTYPTGTAQAGASGQITLASSASSVEDAYNHCGVKITSGTGAGEWAIIGDYNGTTKVATLLRDFTTTPDATSVYEIHIPTFTGDAGVGRWLATDATVANVPQFGALPSGNTQPAILRAIVSASISGKSVAIPAKTLTLTDPLIMPLRGVQLIGIGKRISVTGLPEGGSVLAFSGITSDAIQYVGDTGNRRQGSIENLIIDGTDSCDASGVAAHFVQRYFHMRDVEIRRFTSGAGLLLGETWINHFDNCQFRANKDGIAVADGSRYTNFIAGTKSQTFGMSFSGCNAEQNTHYGIYLGNSGGQGWSWRGGVIEGNNISNTAAEVHLDAFCEQINFSDVYMEWKVNQGENYPFFHVGDSDGGAVNGRVSLGLRGCYCYTSRSFGEPFIKRIDSIGHAVNVSVEGTRFARTSSGTSTVSSIDTGTDTFTTSADHWFTIGQEISLASTGTIPGGLVASKKYYVLTTPTSTTFTVSTTRGGGTLNVTSSGSGTITVSTGQFFEYYIDSGGVNRVYGHRFDGKQLSPANSVGAYVSDYAAMNGGLQVGDVYSSDGTLRVVRSYQADYQSYLSGATPSAANRSVIAVNNTSATNVTGFAGGEEGQELTVYFHGSNSTLIHNAGVLNLIGGVNRATSQGDTFRFFRINNIWHEVGPR